MASVSIVQKNFSPKPLSQREVVGSILAELQNRQKPKMVNLAKETIRTWDDPPGIEGKFTFAGGDTNLQLALSGSHKQVWKWLWLNFGTQARYAVMENPYYPKTSPGRLQSQSGGGNVAYIHVRPNPPRIQPRGWDKIMERIMMRTYASDIQRAIDRGWDAAVRKGKVT